MYNYVNDIYIDITNIYTNLQAYETELVILYMENWIPIWPYTYQILQMDQYNSVKNF